MQNTLFQFDLQHLYNELAPEVFFCLSPLLLHEQERELNKSKKTELGMISGKHL